jgi:hypothetical protein
MAAPTSEDAHLYIQLLNTFQQPDLFQDWNWATFTMKAASLKEFDQQHPVGSADRARFLRVTLFYESVGALVSRGLVHEDLVFDQPLGFDAFWENAGPLVKDWREHGADDAFAENVAWLALRNVTWRETVWRPKLEAIPTDRPPSKQWGETQGHVGFTKS